MQDNYENVAEIIKQALEKSDKERGQINVLIAGRTGVGKSTLINAVFQGKIAETGQGKPVTKNTREITKKGIPLSIWDTRGLEMSAYRETIRELERIIEEKTKEADSRKHIHVAWICIHEDGRRVEDAEIELVKMLSKHMPTIGVITKARSDQGFKAEVQRLLPDTKNVVRVRALKEEMDEGQILSPMGLTSLVELTAEVVPEGLQRALAAAQKVSVEKKKNEALKAVGVATTAAGAAGATPIPFSDAFVIVPIQILMLARISSAFGLELSKAFLGTIVSAAAGATGATVIGRTLVANLFKIIPGAGSFAGGLISGSTAALLTGTLGNLYIATLTALFTESNGEKPSESAIEREFKLRLSNATPG